MEIKEKIRKFLSRFVGDRVFEDTDNIFEKGLVNSLFAMQLVVFIENDFSIIIQNEDLELDNFKDVNSICALIESKSK